MCLVCDCLLSVHSYQNDDGHSENVGDNGDDDDKSAVDDDDGDYSTIILSLTTVCVSAGYIPASLGFRRSPSSRS